MPDSNPAPSPQNSGDEELKPLVSEANLWDLDDDFFEDQPDVETPPKPELPIADVPEAPTRGHVKTIGKKVQTSHPNDTSGSPSHRASIKVLGSENQASEKPFVAKKSVDDEELKMPLSRRKRTEIQENLTQILRGETPAPSEQEANEAIEKTAAPKATAFTAAELKPDTSTRSQRPDKFTTDQLKAARTHKLRAELEELPELEPQSTRAEASAPQVTDVSQKGLETKTESSLDKKSPAPAVDSVKRSHPNDSTPPSADSSPSPQPNAGPPQSPFSISEKVSLATLLAGLCIFAVLAAVSAANQIVLAEDDRIPPDFPLTGTVVTVDEIVTSWRAPRRGGEHPDPAIIEDAFIPVATITFGSDTPQTSVRLFFENDQGEIAGDPRTFEIKGGDTIEFAGTKGFEFVGGLNSYITRDTNTWHLVIGEFQQSGSGSAIAKLAGIPLSSFISE